MEQKIFVTKTEEEVLRELKEMPGAYRMYQGWNEELRDRFVAFCMGKKTLPVLYDAVFKKLMNPDTHPERLEDCISCLLKQRVTIQTVLPVEDILMDGVSTIIFYEKSVEEFKAYPEHCIHHARMVCDSGLKLNFLQEFYLVALDVFRKSEYSKHRNPKDRLAGWLSFFCTEDADEAEALCQDYPWLSALYAEMAEFGRRPEELMTMFSEFLREMDRNTIRYMVDDMKEQIEKGKAENAELQQEIAKGKAELAEINKTLEENKAVLAEKDEALAMAEEEITRLKALLKKKEQ